MCGIIGYVGARQATPLLVGGLRKLEYRGYDSAGVVGRATTAARRASCAAAASCRASRRSCTQEPAPGTVGIGHTRWATHGRPERRERAPAQGRADQRHPQRHHREPPRAARRARGERRAVLVGDRHRDHRAPRRARSSRRRADDLTTRCARALAKVRGSYAFVVMSDKEPGTLVAAKNASPLVVGLGDGENFVASDVTAILRETRKVIFIDEGEIVDGHARRRRRSPTSRASRTSREPKTITWSAVQAEKGGFKHFMLKEIHEQPRAVADTLVGRVDLEHDDVSLDGVELDVAKIKRVMFVACGTSYHASLVGEFLDRGARADPGRGRPRVASSAIAIRSSARATSSSRSASRARRSTRWRRCARPRRRARRCSRSRTSSSRRSRALADYAFYTHAGPEIGVASTKAFTTQLVAIALLAIHLGRRTGALSTRARAGAARRARAAAAEDARRRRERRAAPGARAALRPRARLPVPRPRRAVPDRARGRAQAQGDLVHPRRGLRRRRDEARADRADRRARCRSSCSCRAGRTTRRSCRTSPRCARARARSSRSRRSGDNEIGSHADDVVLVPDTALELQPILTVLPLQLLELLRRRRQGHRRRPAAQPRQVRHRRVMQAKLTHFDDARRRAHGRGRREARDRARRDRERRGRDGAGDRAGDRAPARSARATCSASRGSPASRRRSARRTDPAVPSAAADRRRRRARAWPATRVEITRDGDARSIAPASRWRRCRGRRPRR